MRITWRLVPVLLCLSSLVAVPKYEKNKLGKVALRERKERAAYAYVDYVLSPPAEAIDPESFEYRLWTLARMIGVAAFSVLVSKGVVYAIRLIPVIRDTEDFLEKRISLCKTMIEQTQLAMQMRDRLRDLFQGRGPVPAQVEQLEQLPVPDFAQHLGSYLAQKAVLVNAGNMLEKGLAAVIFFLVCRYCISKHPKPSWTFKGIVGKVVAEWPEHKYSFPASLRPLFNALHDAYVARGKLENFEERDAELIISLVFAETCAAREGH